MTRPGKIPSQVEFELRIFRSRGGRLNHLANEAVVNPCNGALNARRTGFRGVKTSPSKTFPSFLRCVLMVCISGEMLRRRTCDQKDGSESELLEVSFVHYPYPFTHHCTNERKNIGVYVSSQAAETPLPSPKHREIVCLLVGCLMSQQQASVSQGRICSHNFTCCHTEIEVADPTFYLTQSQYTGTGPNSPSADPVTPGAWQGSHWSANL